MVLKTSETKICFLIQKIKSILFCACENVFDYFSQKSQAIRYIEEYIDKSVQIYVHLI